MDAHKLMIADIFNGSKVLEIPFFQRAYVWGKDQWERFLEDVEAAIQLETPHFMGSVILKQQPTSTSSSVGDVRTVIDGQQRLTTLSILVKVLCLKTDTMRKFDKRFRLDDDRAVIQHNHNDIDAYNAIMDLDEPLPTEKKDNISKCYQYFLEHLVPERINFEKLLAMLFFVGIDLDTNDDEQQIFDTINSLGVRLTTAELLKNYFFGRDDLELFNRYWVDVFEKDDETKNYWDQEITTGRKKRSFIDQFFFSYLQIKLQDKSLNISADKKIEFSKVDRLFDSYKQFIQLCFNGDKHAILDELREYALIFKRIFNPALVDSELSTASSLERLNVIIFALDTTTLIPYVLFIEHSISDAAVKNDLYAYLESYIMRRLVTRQTTKNYNQLFSDRLILNRVLTKQALIDYLTSQDDKINRMPTDTEVRAGFHESTLTNKYAAGVLYLIESKVRDQSRYSTQLLGLSKYSLEHLMPKKWHNHWTLDETSITSDERDRNLLTLGNLTIITQSLNASIRDSDWNTKKSGKGDHGGLNKYADGIEIFSKYLEEPVWNESTISKRADDLADKALKIWSIHSSLT